MEFKTGRDELAKVLTYYGLIDNTDEVEQKIVCPFHGDVNPSMKVNFIKGDCFCFGCQRTYDALSFAMEMEQRYHEMTELQSTVEYFRILKSKKVSDIHVAKVSRKQRMKQSEIDKQEAEDFYFGLRTVKWVRDSKTDDEVHEVGQYMKNRGFSLTTLTRCKAKLTYQKFYPIVFPMMDNGEFKGWVCRTNDKRVEARRKYLYNTGFSRIDTLVGDYEQGCTPYICEGYMDQLKLFQFGVKNRVAILGWKISEEQVKKLKAKGIKTVISALDNDKYGRQGTRVLERYFTVIRFQFDENVKDPGEMTKESFARMNKKTLKGSK